MYPIVIATNLQENLFTSRIFMKSEIDQKLGVMITWVNSVI